MERDPKPRRFQSALNLPDLEIHLQLVHVRIYASYRLGRNATREAHSSIRGLTFPLSLLTSAEASVVSQQPSLQVPKLS